MSRRRAGISPSLFPFLAVLICTLGTLILLLALVAQQANDAAVAQIEQERQEKLASAKLATPVTPSVTPVDENRLTADAARRLIGEGRFRVEQLVSFRDQQTSELERKRDEITHVEFQMRKLQDKLEQLSNEVDSAMSDEESPGDAIAENEKTLVLMREEAEKMRGEIAELETSERGVKPRVVIVPHRGPNGTQRRPVYVLCTAEGLQVMPEGARITRAEALAAAEADDPNSNPLGAALRVARLHAMQQYGDQLPPYPLLIVRPDGIYMYRVASALMKDWDDQYGYELVPGEVDLAFPGGDNVLRREMDMAIQRSVARNYAFARGPGGAGGRGNGGNGNGSGSGSGSGIPRANQFAGNDSGADRGASSPGGSSQAGGNAESGGNAQPGGSALGAGGRSSSASRGTPARALPTLSARDLDRQSQSHGFSLARDQRFNNAGGAYAEPPGNRSGSYGATGNGSVTSQSDALNDFLQGKTPAGFEDPGAGEEGSQGAGSEGTDSQMAGSQGTSSGDSRDASTAADSNTAATSNSTGTSGSSNASNPSGTSTPSGASTPSGDSSASSMNSIAMTLRESGAGGSPGASSDPSGASADDATSDAEFSPSQAEEAAAQVAQKMVRREGKNWAMPDAFRGMNGTEFVRPISMRCHHDRYEIIEQGRVVQTFPFGQEGVYEPTLRLATSIRDRVMTWGATMQGGYWKPQLEVSVGPHAEQRFNELQSLMHNSGVDVVRRSP